MKCRPIAVAGLASMSLALGLTAQPVHAQSPKNTLVVVPHADLRILDPLGATVTITLNHASSVYDELFAWDVNLLPKPQMVGDYQISSYRLT